MPAADVSLPTLGHVHVEAVSSVISKDLAPPDQKRRISAAIPLGGAALRSHLRVVLYFPGAAEDAWSLAAHYKESLSRTLTVDHLFGGRLRRNDAAGGGLELRLNDAGVRMVQAKADFTMAELLASPAREAAEAHLAYWADVDEEKPHFSALFYIQVTGFPDNGISIGLSCSLLLADPLLLLGFLHKWAKIHAQARERFSTAAIFNLGAFKKVGGQGYLKSTPVAGGGGSVAGRTIFFDGAGGSAAAAVAEAARRAGEIPDDAAKDFLMIIAESDRMSELKLVEACKEEVTATATPGEEKEESWSPVGDWFGGGELAFTGESGPAEVSWKIVTTAEKPLVIVMPPPGRDGGRGMISVTLPSKEV